MQTTELEVTGMMCQACVGHVTRALQSVAGVHSATVDLDAGRAQVQHEGAATSDMIAAIEEEGYEARDLTACSLELALLNMCWGASGCAK